VRRRRRGFFFFFFHHLHVLRSFPAVLASLFAFLDDRPLLLLLPLFPFPESSISATMSVLTCSPDRWHFPPPHRQTDRPTTPRRASRETSFLCFVNERRRCVSRLASLFAPSPRLLTTEKHAPADRWRLRRLAPPCLDSTSPSWTPRRPLPPAPLLALALPPNLLPRRASVLPPLRSRCLLARDRHPYWHNNDPVVVAVFVVVAFQAVLQPLLSSFLSPVDAPVSTDRRSVVRSHFSKQPPAL